jgi:phosphoserine phosphatase
VKANPTLSPVFAPSAHEFLETVLTLKPRVAVFDCDGTLWDGDSGADFFYWAIERGVVSGEIGKRAVARYAEYKAGKVDEKTMCGEMVTINAGIPERTMEQAAEEFFSTVVEQRIFQEMLHLTHRLAEIGCELWAVSSTNIWVVREGVKGFGIAPDHVLAAAVEIEQGAATDRLVHVPTDEGKALALQQALAMPIDVCCGNSVHDSAMLEIARHPFAVNPTPALEEEARQKSWGIYWPQKKP